MNVSREIKKEEAIKRMRALFLMQLSSSRMMMLLW